MEKKYSSLTEKQIKEYTEASKEMRGIKEKNPDIFNPDGTVRKGRE
jgi:hypothetical protein